MNQKMIEMARRHAQRRNRNIQQPYANLSQIDLTQLITEADRQRQATILQFDAKSIHHRRLQSAVLGATSLPRRATGVYASAAFEHFVAKRQVAKAHASSNHLHTESGTVENPVKLARYNGQGNGSNRPYDLCNKINSTLTTLNEVREDEQILKILDIKIPNVTISQTPKKPFSKFSALYKKLKTARSKAVISE